MSKLDAPGYSESADAERTCSNCRFASSGSCILWNFSYDPQYRCKNWGEGQEQEKEHTGVAVAFVPRSSEASHLAIAGGEPQEELHLTLVYLGNKRKVGFTQKQLIAALDDFSENHAPVSGVVNGVGYFFQEEEKQTVVWAHFDSPDLPGFRQRLVDHLRESGIDFEQNHGFTPHITLQYRKDEDEGSEDDSLSFNLPIEFDHITMMWGGVWVSFPLTGGNILDRLFRAWRTRSLNSIKYKRPCCQ